MKIIQGSLEHNERRIALIVSRRHEVVAYHLAEGAKSALKRHGVPLSGVNIYWTSGLTETALIARELALSGSWDALVVLGALGCDELPLPELMNRLGTVELEQRIPVISCILQGATQEELLNHMDSSDGTNKGSLAVAKALEVVSLIEQIRLNRTVEN